MKDKLRLRFRPLSPVTELASPFDSGWRYWVAVAGAAVLLFVAFIHLAILLKLIGLL